MKAIPALALLMVLAGAPCNLRAADDAGLAERQKLVGVWKGYAVEGTGERPGGPVKLTVTITTNEISAVQDDNKNLGAGTFKVDTNTTPWRLEGAYARGQVPKGTYLGIYQLDGDTLKWCTAMPRSKEHPTEFRTVKGQYLMILKREAKEMSKGK